MKKHTYELNEIEDLKKTAFDFELEGAEILNNYSLRQLQDMANGIGSESMPTWMRSFISVLNPSLESVAFIHDVEWSGKEKSKEHFKASNKRFKNNGYKCAVYYHGWWNPRRYLVMRTALRFANICQLFGWKAYLSGKMEDYDCNNAELNHEKI